MLAQNYPTFHTNYLTRESENLNRVPKVVFREGGVSGYI